MATPGNRSPSPVSTRPNPNSRTPETNSTPMRRSFSGNPFPRPSILSNPKSFPPATPANSPAADLGRRHSMSKDSSRAYEEKENEKDQNFKPVKVRSPVIGKGTKNFMNPTISAASKITASPKKRVLVERNEPVRTSLSFSDGSTPFGSMNSSDLKEDSKSEMGLGVHDSNDSEITSSVKKEEGVLDIPLDESLNSQVPLNSQNFSDMKPVEFDSITASNGCKNKQPSGSLTSPIIAPLDSDPSLPIYDPKTNYLSPRPQFLRYKPNPRIQIYLEKEKGLGSTEQGKRLEESFLSETLSDTEFTEENDSENSTKESEEEDSSAEVVNEEVEPHDSEPNPNSMSFNTHVSKEIIEEKIVLKPKFFTRSKSIALILVLLIACLSVSVTDSPVLDLSVYKDLSISKFSDSSEIPKFAKECVDGFARNLQQFSARSVVFLSKVISSLDEADKLSPLQFVNLTFLLEDPFVDGYLKVGHGEVINEEIHEEDDVEPEEEGEVEIQGQSEVINEEIHEEDDVEPEEEEGEVEIQLFEEKSETCEEAVEGHGIEEAHLTLEVEGIEPDTSEAARNQEESDTDLGLTANQEESDMAPEFRPEAEEEVETGDIKCDNELSSGIEIESTMVDPNPKSYLEEKDAMFGDVSSSPNDKFSVRSMQTIALLAVAIVAAATAFVYLKHRRNKTPSAPVLDPFFTSKLMISSPPSQIWPADVDVVGESCPSEMSSFQKSLSYSKRGLREADETQSQEKRNHRRMSKRESLASSSEYSMGSPSYGSFTTYEKIGNGDEEIVTPVRRSSRINKNQVTSS